MADNYVSTTTVNDVNYDLKDAKAREDISTLDANLTAGDNLKFKFATDGNGNYGYLDADDNFISF